MLDFPFTIFLKTETPLQGTVCKHLLLDWPHVFVHFPPGQKKNQPWTKNPRMKGEESSRTAQGALGLVWWRKILWQLTDFICYILFHSAILELISASSWEMKAVSMNYHFKCIFTRDCHETQEANDLQKHPSYLPHIFGKAPVLGHILILSKLLNNAMTSMISQHIILTDRKH